MGAHRCPLGPKRALACRLYADLVVFAVQAATPAKTLPPQRKAGPNPPGADRHPSYASSPSTPPGRRRPHGLGGQVLEQLQPEPLTGPAIEAVVDRCGGAVVTWAVLPPTADLQHLKDARDHGCVPHLLGVAWLPQSRQSRPAGLVRPRLGSTSRSCTAPAMPTGRAWYGRRGRSTRRSRADPHRTHRGA